MSYYSTPRTSPHPPPPPEPKRRGLGDVVESITRRTGIKRLVEWTSRKTNKPCGCQQRKEALNNFSNRMIRR